ncbi:hypothetical protein [Aquibium microcysteis]|uniref:hypothetical protein n=1 Tax=Aquibium microcysteis TaxID=675281 RepID=UPI00165D0CA6|nr:hypothetical protein [Aquibium microcysteis]
MLDPRDLRDFMDGFYGYGNPQAALWFIGMEEGGGNSLDEVGERIAIWDGLGRPECADLAVYHDRLSAGFPAIAAFFAPDGSARIQSTWRGLIRILLKAKGLTPTREKVRDYQVSKWGRSDGEARLLNLLPLPAPSTSHWPYSAIEALPELESRQKYLQAWAPRRLAVIRRTIAAFRPRDVVMYGATYNDLWEELAGGRMEQQQQDAKVRFRSDGTTRYWAIGHVSRGSNATFDAIGQSVGLSDPAGIPYSSVYEFLCAGARLAWGFGPDEAIGGFLELYPYADEASLRRELEEDFARNGQDCEGWTPGPVPFQDAARAEN